MRNIDLSDWHSILISLVGLVLITLLGVGVRLLVQMTIQQRRERMNRQINERLRTLIAAYKTLGGSFTGDLSVDPSHLGDRRKRAAPADPEEDVAIDLSPEAVGGSDRKRRIRDAVEAALSDIILLGTEEHVRLAERAANELVAGRPVHTHDLVVSLRAFIRKALDLDAIPADLAIPMQGPARPSASSGKGKSDSRQGGAGGRGGGGAGGAGMGMGMGLGLGLHGSAEEPGETGH
jgi:hypothetical protein